MNKIKVYFNQLFMRNCISQYNYKIAISQEKKWGYKKWEN